MIRLVAGPGSSQGGLPPGLMKFVNCNYLFGSHIYIANTCIFSPQDYAWGPTGLDNIITALLNQVEEVQHRGLRAEGTGICNLKTIYILYILLTFPYRYSAITYD
jgi:hypothetical protein